MKINRLAWSDPGAHPGAPIASSTTATPQAGTLAGQAAKEAIRQTRIILTTYLLEYIFK